ncbi:MAG: hypothetical protein ACLP3C_11065 [Mycobacterium sp.]|uniref:hypothetical protein n=1 Tax=Mycobacterium sp. TaxID=1785 RepID=UPI003F97507E
MGGLHARDTVLECFGHLVRVDYRVAFCLLTRSALLNRRLGGTGEATERVIRVGAGVGHSWGCHPYSGTEGDSGAGWTTLLRFRPDPTWEEAAQALGVDAVWLRDELDGSVAWDRKSPRRRRARDDDDW